MNQIPNIEETHNTREKVSTKSDAGGSRYVYLKDQPEIVIKTVQVSDHCNVDLDEQGYPIGIEIV